MLERKFTLKPLRKYRAKRNFPNSWHFCFSDEHGVRFFSGPSNFLKMLRAVAQKALLNFRAGITRNAYLSQVRMHHQETDEEFDRRYLCYFEKQDIDGWEIRKAMNDLAGLDLVPEPKIIIAALKACRRVNDFALAVRWLETIKWKSVADKDIYPYILQEIRPTLDELGINTPEELGYDKPELALQSVYEM